MVSGKNAAEAVQRVGDANVPAGVNYYEKTTVIIVKDEYVADLEKELNR